MSKTTENIEEIFSSARHKVLDENSFGGSLYTKIDVASIMDRLCAQVLSCVTEAESVFEDTISKQANLPIVVPDRYYFINDEHIERIAEKAKSYAKEYVEDCVDNYDFEDDFETRTESHTNEIRICYSVSVDSNSVHRQIDFPTDDLIDSIKKIAQQEITLDLD